MAIVLTYDTANWDATALANRQMRSAGRTVWNEDDYNACVARIEHLAIVFYRENCAPEYGPVDLRAAFCALQQTKGMKFILRGR
jgi:hypothetical protein